MAAGIRKEGESFADYRARLDREQAQMELAEGKRRHRYRGVLQEDRPAPVVNNPGDRASLRRMKLRGERA